MTSEFVITVCREMLYTAMTLALPVLLVGLVVGLTAAILQAVTSVQEQTLSMIPKMIAVAVTLIVLMPWMLTKLQAFALGSFGRLVGA